MARGRGHCTTCDKILTLTYAGTVPLHSKEGRGGPTCEGSNTAPKPGSVTQR